MRPFQGIVPIGKRELVAEGFRTKSTASLIIRATAPSASALVVVTKTRPRCRLPDSSSWYAIRRVAACQVSAARRKRDGAAPNSLLVDIAVNDFGGESALRKRLLHRLREHYGAMLPAGAAERNGQITFPLANVMRDQISQQAFDAPQEFPGLRKRADIPPHFRVLAREGPQTWHKMRVGQKSHVEDQVRIRRHSVAVP